MTIMIITPLTLLVTKW